jgi:hypothetical protein
LEQKEWDALQDELKDTEEQEVAANETEAEKKMILKK